MNLLQQLRTIAITFECLSNQEDWMQLVRDSQVLADISLIDAWQGIEASIRILETDHK